MERLQRQGVIRGFVTVLNVGLLGYSAFRVYLRCRKLDPDLEQRMVEYFQAHPSIAWIATLSGGWDFELIVFAPSIGRFSAILDGIRKRWEGVIAAHAISIATCSYHLARCYSGRRSKKAVPYYEEGRGEAHVDRLDWKILARLTRNARTPTSEIAQAVGLTENAVKYRVRQLRQSGVIQAYRLWLEPSRIGLEMYKTMLTLQSFDEGKEKRLLGFCREIAESAYFIRCAGAWDAEVEFEVPSHYDYRKILLQLRKAFSDSIQEYETLLIVAEHKMEYLPTR